MGEAVPTGAPRDLRATAVSATEVRLNWRPPEADRQNGDLLGYKIFYRHTSELKDNDLRVTFAIRKLNSIPSSSFKRPQGRGGDRGGWSWTQLSLAHLPGHVHQLQRGHPRLQPRWRGAQVQGRQGQDAAGERRSYYVGASTLLGKGQSRVYFAWPHKFCSFRAFPVPLAS